MLTNHVSSNTFGQSFSMPSSPSKNQKSFNHIEPYQNAVKSESPSNKRKPVRRQSLNIIINDISCKFETRSPMRKYSIVIKKMPGQTLKPPQVTGKQIKPSEIPLKDTNVDVKCNNDYIENHKS